MERSDTLPQFKRDDLPIWMQRAMRGTDWGVLIVVGFCLLLAWSFIVQPGLPRTNASEHYVFRAADTTQAFAEGRLYPRWSPYAINGYGAPIPNYYPPGAAYVPALLDYFITNDPTLAVKLVYVASLCLAGTAVYALVMRRAGAAAGVIAALLYVYSPYVSLVAPHLLGDLPGVMCLGLIPALFWSVERLLRLNRPFDMAYAALVTAALVLTDIPAAIIGWTLTAALIAWNSADYPRWYLALGASVMGVGIAGCYWLPALAEADLVQWVERPREIPHLLTLAELFTPLRQIDPGALVPVPQFTLGWAAPAFTLVSIPVIVRRRAGFHGLFLILGAALTSLALAVFQSEVWLLGAISLCLAIAGSGVVLSKRARLFLPILGVIILIAAMPAWIAPRWSDAPIDTSAIAQIDYETRGFGIPALPDGDPLPTTISPTTAPDRALIASYRSDAVTKIQTDPNAQIGLLEHGTHGDRIQLQTFAPTVLHVLTAFFPGWTARLNTAFMNLTPSSAGLIDVNLPNAVRGELIVSLGTTVPRTIGWLLTWLNFILLGIITLYRSRRGGEHHELLELLPRTEARLLGGLLGGAAAVLALFVLPFAPLATEPQPKTTLAGSATIDNRSDAGLEVLAYQLGATHYHPGDTIDLTLYWHTLRFLTDNYRVRVSLLDLTTGDYRLPNAPRTPGDYPTARWLPRLFVTDPYRIALPVDFPTGTYSPALEVCVAAGEECGAPEPRLTFFEQDGSTYGQVLVLPIILIVE
ncbi:MAG: hypothetical protein IT319_01220 [Anaerolineae bacterium]|nr:hypothetical protein [Anaerolineae bacterium]